MTKASVVVSHDPELADVRKRVLENAGFTVIPATTENAVEEARRCEGVRLIMLGYSLPPADKRRVWVAAKENCRIPILELHQNGTQELVDINVFPHQSRKPDDFMDSVRRLLTKPRNGQKPNER